MPAAGVGGVSFLPCRAGDIPDLCQPAFPAPPAAALIPLNLGMLFSTPVIGGHYLIDVLAGIAVTLLAVAIAEKLFSRGNSAAA